MLTITNLGFEATFDTMINGVKESLTDFQDYDLVIGIPFSAENRQMGTLLHSIDKVLQSWMGRRQLILCVGEAQAETVLSDIEAQKLQHPLIAFLLPEFINGRGSAIRAIIEISKQIDANLLLLSANMTSEQGPGMEGTWLEGLLTPIQGHYDLVLGSLRRNLGADSIAHLLAGPILEVFYGFRVHDPLGGIYGFSHDFVEMLAHEARFWGRNIAGYGVDFWLLTRALSWNLNICEVNLNGWVTQQSLPVRNQIFADTVHTLFEAMKRDNYNLLKDRLVIKVADVLVHSASKRAEINKYSVPDLLHNYRTGCEQLAHMVRKCSRGPELIEICQLSDEDFVLDNEVWAGVLLDAMQVYVFEQEEQQADIIRFLTAVYNGRVASYLLEMRTFQNNLSHMKPEQRNETLVKRMEAIRSNLTEIFWKEKSEYSKLWSQRYEQVRPPLVPLGYMEYVPGKPIVIPKKIIGKDGIVVQTDNIFRALRKRYDDRFNRFIYESLGVSENADSQQMVEYMEDYMEQLEQALAAWLPGDLYSDEGMAVFAKGIFDQVSPLPIYTVSADIIREWLVRFPPVNLMIPLGFYKPEQLLEKVGPRHGLTYSNLVENSAYANRGIMWLEDVIKPDNFEWVKLEPIILPKNLRLGALAHGKISFLNRLTGRIVISPLEKEKGGKYPRLRYFTSIIRRMAVAENYTQLFLLNSSERKNIGLKLRNSLQSVDRGDDFSALNIFENYHHRSLVNKIKTIADQLQQQNRPDLSRLLNIFVDGYGLSQVMGNGVFLTCTVWSWASYSFKGGLKIPAPLTTSVENRWFNHEFLETLYQELGYEKEEIKAVILRLIQEGKSYHNLLDTLLPARPKDVAVIIQDATNEPSKSLRRYKGNPIIEPLEGSVWESKYVLNPGALRIKDQVYLFYRAVGQDDISHIGLAVTDGYRVLQRLPQPIFSPATPAEKMGCEDPRLIIVGDKIYMLYTAYDGNIAQIAVASIGVEEFQNGRYTNWHREGLAFTNIWDKDAILFPEKINDRYVIYHRIEPSIWVTYTKELRFPLKEKHAIIIGPRPGHMWDSLKIGAGAQPLKTKYGWLLIYHGVDHNYVYRLGVILTDLNNPDRVIYRSPNPILEPTEDYEVGLSGAWVPNVVFTCGAAAGSDKEILADDDEILVYYGAADTSIGLATAALADLIPEKFRI